jgi:predicted CoA-binding protein
MKKLTKDFLQGNEVLFVGYSSRNSAYSKGIYQAFTNHNIKVYPYNTKENASYDVKVYKNLEELPVMPKNAFVLLNKENTTKAVKLLIKKGVKKILFYNAKIVDSCSAASMQRCTPTPSEIMATSLPSRRSTARPSGTGAGSSATSPYLPAAGTSKVTESRVVPPR